MHYRADSTLVRYSTATTTFPDLYRIIAPLGEVMRLSGNLHFFRESSFEISFSQEHTTERPTQNPAEISESILTSENKLMTTCIPCFLAALVYFTCWSSVLGARRCGLLGLCRVRTGRSPLMTVAPRSHQGSSETGTWYRSCRCQKTLDLKVETCLC